MNGPGTAENATVSWGLIGVGDIVRRRVGEALRSIPGSVLAAVAAAHPERAEAFAREYSVPRWHEDWRDLVRDPDVSAVYVATPVACHRAQVLAAARAGKHVLCEKPLALNARQGQDMVNACRRAAVLLGVAYYRRYYPLVSRIREILTSGEIGTPVLTQINAFSCFNPGLDHPRRWLLNRKIAGGGPLKDFGCHRIELLMHLFGEVRTAVHRQGNLLWRRDVEDTAVLGLVFTRQGWATLTVSHATAEAVDTLDVYGSAGSLHAPSLNGEVLLVKSAAGEREEHHPPHPNKHYPLVAAFADAVRSGGPFAVNGEIGVAVDRITDRVYAGKRYYALSLGHG